MKNKFFYLFILSFFLTVKTFAQDEKKTGPKVDNVPSEKKHIISEQGKMASAKESTPNASSSKNSKQVETPKDYFQVDENDQYQGRKVEFLSQITLKELPSDFPKYEKWMGIKNYNQIVSDYYSKHLDIVIESVRQKLTRTNH